MTWSLLVEIRIKTHDDVRFYDHSSRIPPGQSTYDNICPFLSIHLYGYYQLLHQTFTKDTFTQFHYHKGVKGLVIQIFTGELYFSPKAVSQMMGHAKEIITVDTYGDTAALIKDCLSELQPFIDKVLPEEGREKYKDHTNLLINVDEYLVSEKIV